MRAQSLVGACCEGAATTEGLPKACATRSEPAGSLLPARAFLGACCKAAGLPKAALRARSLVGASCEFPEPARLPGAVTTEGTPKACAARSEPAGSLLGACKGPAGSLLQGCWRGARSLLKICPRPALRVQSCWEPAGACMCREPAGSLPGCMLGACWVR